MVDQTRIPLIGRDGTLGWINLDEQPQETQDALIRLKNGQAVSVPADLLVRQMDGSFYLPMSSGQFRTTADDNAVHREAVVVIPVIAEEAKISKREITRGRVHIEKTVEEREETIDVPTVHHEVQVERLPINRWVETPPEVRQEGDTTIIPVLEEVLVVEKRLRLKEEVRVTRVQRETHAPERWTLREESVEVRRTSGSQE